MQAYLLNSTIAPFLVSPGISPNLGQVRNNHLLHEQISPWVTPAFLSEWTAKLRRVHPQGDVMVLTVWTKSRHIIDPIYFTFDSLN